MNPILSDMYSTVIPSAPFIIAAYAIVWLALLVYVTVVVRSLKKTEAHIALLEEAVRKREAAGREAVCERETTDREAVREWEAAS